MTAVKRPSPIAFLLIAGLLCGLSGGDNASAASKNPLAGLTPMSRSELESYRGGFLAPGGLEIAVGVQVQTSVNGQIIGAAPSVVPVAGQPSVAVTAQLTQVAAQASVSTVVQYATGNVSTAVQNTANNAVIQQIRRLNITVNNYSAVLPSMTPALANIVQQLNFGIVALK